jgi:hypothetical protein
MTVEQAKAALARIGGAPSGTIPKSAQESVIRETLELLPEFCKKVFGKSGFPSNGRGKSKGNSHYWVVPDMCRIDRERGLCFLEQKSRYALNLLTVWMAHTGIPIDDQGICRDKVLIERSISTLRRWCGGIRNEKEKRAKEEESSSAPGWMLKKWVSDAVFRDGRSSFKGTSEKIRKLVSSYWDWFDEVPSFSSRRLFLELLESWQVDRQVFTLKMNQWGKKRVFYLDLLP